MYLGIINVLINNNIFKMELNLGAGIYLTPEDVYICKFKKIKNFVIVLLYWLGEKIY